MLRTIRETIQTGVFAGQLTVPNHYHNMTLQLWAETGTVGVGLLSLAILLLGWRMPSADKLGFAGLRAAGLAGGMMVVACVSFDLWNERWWPVGGLLGAPRSEIAATRSRAKAVTTISFYGSASSTRVADTVEQLTSDQPAATGAGMSASAGASVPTATISTCCDFCSRYWLSFITQ